MKLVIKLSGEDRSVVESLAVQGITARLVKGGVIVDPNKRGDAYEIPDVPFNIASSFLIEAEEEGGGMTNTGSGTVVCGWSGKALRPYRSGCIGGACCFLCYPSTVWK